MKEKKKLPLLLGILLVAITITIGVTYALWQITLQQESTNVITTGCFNIEYTDNNPINLQNAYPITDEEGSKLVPYTFTITNICNSSASYQINLEILEDSTLLDYSIIKMKLNTLDSIKLSTKEEVQTTIMNAMISYKIETGYLKENESKTFDLRVWMDEDTPTEDIYMNKTLNSKITIVSSYFAEIPKTPTEATKDFLMKNSLEGSILEDDETADHNMRYIGSSPNNYIDIGDTDSSSNKVLWRIVGLMNNVSDGSEKKQSRLKVVRSESLGSLLWDSSESEINTGFGVNEWSDSDLMKLLNPGYEEQTIGGSLYWNKMSGTCYVGMNNQSDACDFNDSGLSLEAKKYIEPAVWQLGANPDAYTNASNGLVSHFYEYERSDNTGKICTGGNNCTDTVTRYTTWQGLVGLMNISDYGYATSGGITTNHASCMSKELSNWNAEEVSDCKSNNWLYKSKDTATLNPYASASLSNRVFLIDADGQIATSSAYGLNEVYPVVFLKENIRVVSGNGSIESPFQIILDNNN